MLRETMSSRERVITAIEHREPDRVPIDVSAVDEVMEALIGHYGIKTGASAAVHSYIGTDGTLLEGKNREAQLRLLETLHVDFRWAWAPYCGPKLQTYPDGSREGLFGIKRDGLFFGYAVAHPLKEAQTISDIENYPWDLYANVDHYDYDRYREECRFFHEAGYAVYGGPWAPITFWAMDLMGMDRFMMTMYDQPEIVERLLQRIADFYFRQAQIMFEKGKGVTDIFFMGDDYGVQNCPMMSRKLWMRFIAPHLSRLWALAKAHGLKVQLHSCGSVRALIPDFIEMGVDVLDPIQVRAAGMNPAELKKEYGGLLTFHGSMDTQETLPFGTVHDVREEVRHRMTVMAPRGGFIISPSQHLLTEIPTENIVAMYEAAYEYGFY
ncbi:MAG TPA: uroporphyrinogen decarboxylase family protein [Atribacteraceae bacterium]|nr:uroporphyrinogen decarboxylase family protein [Atribacteraceae bacterium]